MTTDSRSLRVVYMGTPDFAVPALRTLQGMLGVDVVAVYSRPDAVSKRGKQPVPSPVSQYAIDSGLPLKRVLTFKDPDATSELVDLSPDIIIVAAYGMILPAAILEIPRNGCINLHASLLPRWRGAAPIQRAILAGDLDAGVCIMRMEEGLDTGPYCACIQTPIESKNVLQLTAELAELGAQLLADNLRAIVGNRVDWAVQDDGFITYAEKISSADVTLLPHDTVSAADRKVRASSSQAPSRIVVEGQSLTLLEARPASSEVIVTQGQIGVTRQGVFLGLADGALELLLVQKPGKRPVRALDWLRGARIDNEASWS